LVPAQSDENFAFSPDGTKIYVAGNDGILRVYDALTGSLLDHWNVGLDLEGIAISHDGRYAVITEGVPVSTHQTNDWTSNTTVAAVYQVDLRSGYVSILQYTGHGDEYTFADVAYADDDTVILGQNILPGWSGWAPLFTLDLNTETFTPHGSYYSGLGSTPSLTEAPVAGNVLVGQLGLSSAEYFLINAAGSAVANNGGAYANGVFGYAGGIEAFAGTGSGGHIAFVSGGLYLYDGNFAFIADLADFYPHLASSPGIAFSHDGKVLFAVDPFANEIDAIALDDYTIIQHIPLGDLGGSLNVLQASNELTLSPDELTFYVSTNNGISAVHRTLDNVRTDGDDSLMGTAGPDTISGGTGNDLIQGLDGNDDLIGGPGDDVLIGGKGDDYYYVDAQADIVIEKAGEGHDVVFASSNFYLYPHIETLVLEEDAGSAFGVGNELDNLIIGNGGNNLLLGGLGIDEVYGDAGNDAIFGEDGNDKLYGENGIDFLVGGTGNDALDGGGGADAAYGQEGDDLLFGGSTFDTDILVGGAGNDTIYGDSGRGDYDLLYGNEGNDTFWVDTPADLVFEQPGEGIDTVHADIGGAGYYLYDNIENLVLEDTTPFGVGNALDNSLTGSASANWLLGGAGNDTLNGKAGNDVLFGQAGSDTFVVEHGGGGDVIGDFAHGSDRINLHDFGFASFAQLQTHFSQVGSDGAIALGGGDFIVLQGVTLSTLDAGDFVL
jgi:Ca2+-binding RTX toxin-like protein